MSTWQAYSGARARTEGSRNCWTSTAYSRSGTSSKRTPLIWLLESGALTMTYKSSKMLRLQRPNNAFEIGRRTSSDNVDTSNLVLEEVPMAARVEPGKGPSLHEQLQSAGSYVCHRTWSSLQSRKSAMKSRPPLSRAFSALLLPLCLALAAPAPAQQDYPNRPIRFITAAAQGGTSDILARVFGAQLTEVLKQPVVWDNRASASGVIAGELTANAPPDGYTLLLAYHQHTVNALLNPKLPYHPVNSFTPITQLTTAGFMLVVNPATPVKNLAEFVDWTRNFKGPLNYGSAGIGTGGHLAGELYKMMTGVKAEHIPYKGSGPALMDLMAGQYHFNFSGMQSVQTLVRSGKLRGLAVTAPKRLAALPDLPAVAEVLPGF